MTNKTNRKRDTKQALAGKRAKLIQVARQVPAGYLRVLPLATAFSVGSQTVTKWLNEAGIPFEGGRGRPKAGQTFSFQDITKLIGETLSQGQRNLDDAASEHFDADDVDMQEME